MLPPSANASGTTRAPSTPGRRMSTLTSRMALLLLGLILPLGVMTYRAIPLVCGLALLLLALSGDWRGAWRRVAAIDRGWSVSLALFLAVAAVSLSWTPNRGAAAVDWCVVVLFVALGVLAYAARPDVRPADMGLAIAAGMAPAAILIVVEMNNEVWLRRALGGKHDASKMNQAAIMMALWLWPTLRIVVDRWGRLAAVGLFLASAIGVFSSHSETARLGLTLSIIAFAACRLGWRSLPAWLAAGLAVVVLVQPLLMAAMRELLPYVQGIKAGHPAERITIWVSFAHAVRLSPWIGWGFDSSGTLGFGPTLYQFPLDLWTGIRDSHPHDMVLQVWVEMGVLGALPLAWLAARTALLAGRLPWPRLSPLAVGSLVTIPVVALVGYGAWQAWWIAILAVLPVLFQVAGRSAPQAP